MWKDLLGVCEGCRDDTSPPVGDRHERPRLRLRSMYQMRKLMEARMVVRRKRIKTIPNN